MEARFFSTLYDDISLALLYSAADVFVAPSVQENLSNAVMESMACGTPVVAFRIGGMPDLIDHRRNGYLAEPFEADDLARGIQWVIESPSRHMEMGREARTKVEAEYEMTKVARQYLDLYQEVTSEGSVGHP
jgi:glycosyltransferase involved in cell wall biosynthesis